jgi:hypothetical protein
MQTYEITGYESGVSRAGVNYLQPADAFQNISNGYIYRQVLQSRQGFSRFSTGPVSDGSRIMGIFEHVLLDNTTQLLVISQQFLYKYNTGTDTFDQIANAGSAPAGGFGISARDFYVSGTTYPFKDGTQRFLFTGQGMSDIYSYDGTDVQSFTLDNADFQAFAGGALTNAWFILWFGERLNIFNPTIAAQPTPQGVLYSGIRNSAGNGDKFNVSGSGLLNADTSEYINGVSINGNEIIMNFSRSNWVLEKTRDVFNPYFIRKVPSVLGTDAPFSSVTWDNLTVSVGKTGILATDGRQSSRFDNKIPDFTENDIDGTTFPLTYGGFDRVNGQFLFSYRSGQIDDLDTQDKVLVNNYEENTWSTFDNRFTVFGQTELGSETVWNSIDENTLPEWATWDTTTDIWNKIGLEATVQKTLAGDDDGFVYQLNTDYNDYAVDITGITTASPCVISTGTQSIKVGDRIAVSDVVGMVSPAPNSQSINNFDFATNTLTGNYYNVTAATSSSITIDLDTTLYTAWSSGGTASVPIEFSAETIPFNPWREQGNRVYVSYIEVLLDTGSGNLLVDVYENEEDAPFRSDIPLIPSAPNKGREWISIGINQESDFLTFVFKQISPAVRIKMTSVRIHCRPGGPSLG